jgi:ammonium transporter, Amt family
MGDNNRSDTPEEHEQLLIALRLSIETIQRNLVSLKEMEYYPSDSPSISPTPSDSFLSSGDTAWMLIATILVFGMTIPGIMLYYAGMVRLQNVLSTAMQGFGVASVITFLWLCFGYSLSFTPVHRNDQNSSPIFGDASRFWLADISTPEQAHQLAPTIPEVVFCCYQLAFAIVTPCLICGAFADRMKYVSVLLSLGLWHLVVYCPMAHSNWHPEGFLYKVGVLDFAGGNVVHISAGMSALVAALIIGKRNAAPMKAASPHHNLLLSLIGKSLLIKVLMSFNSSGCCSLIMGWFGFNAGSAFRANEIAGYAILNTQIAGSEYFFILLSL